MVREDEEQQLGTTPRIIEDGGAPVVVVRDIEGMKANLIDRGKLLSPDRNRPLNPTLTMISEGS